MKSKKKEGLNRLTLAGLIITLGIVYGDIGTSPLYVIKAIISGSGKIDHLLIYGALSCIFWTLTLQTTIKYITITLRADNHGEGGIFALFALMRKKSTWAALLTMVGGSTLLADGVITPSITVTSSIEGLNLVDASIPVIPTVLLILTVLFFIQQFGTNVIGRAFGPVMLIWFLMLGTLGLLQTIEYPGVVNAVNPAYAYRFLIHYPKAIILLGAVFLCTTGAEALYSDLGHVGIRNIRVSWVFVKTTLLLNYFGQAAWILNHPALATSKNPFYAIMPHWFLIPGILISTSAAIIASQALISGSYTLISEAVSLNFWPKLRMIYPTYIKGQVYIPFVNWFLWIACSFVVVFFGSSSNMEAAYGLSITITMIMTTLLLSYYLYHKKTRTVLVVMLLTVFLSIEGTFLYANLFKFVHGGWFTIVLASVFFGIMYGWYFGRKIKNRHITFVNMSQYFTLFEDLSKDTTVPKFATNLVYLTKANKINNIESKIIYSIFHKQPKRADTYWLLHVDILNDPNTFEYQVSHLIPGILIKIDFRLGFKIEPKINLYFREVIEDMMEKNEISLVSKYDSLSKHEIPADFVFVNLDRIMNPDFDLPMGQKVIMTLHEFSRFISINDVKALGLDTSNVIEEKVPIIIERPVKHRIMRVFPEEKD